MSTDSLADGGGVSGSPRHTIIMGVSGCGKSTVGQLLAERLGLPFAEGDEFHSAANRAKMAAGIALVDDDRWPWLASLRDWMSAQADAGQSTVVACSALRRAYREVLREARGEVLFVHLRVTPDALAQRMTERVGHYMPPSLLASQLATLEELGPDEHALVLDAGVDVDGIVKYLRENL